MEKDLDKKLYNDYLNGEKEAFELLYNKYKGKIEYFIFNIVKDYQKAEDLTQETFIYVMQNKMEEKYSFKYFIYLIARSKAFNYINVENRRNEITQNYFANDNNQIEKDVLEVITQEETKRELLEAIELLDEKYKNAIYLVNIEGLSYEETAKLLGKTLQNTKSLIHRGKRQLKKILLKKGFDEMNKVVRVFVIILLVTISLTGITYAGVTIYNTFVKEQNKVQTRKLFDVGDGITTYEMDLMANDMTWQNNVRLYYKTITNIEEYEKYKSRIVDLPTISEINFDENFVIIIANENFRTFDEIDMEISDIYADETTTNVIMKQKENPDMNDTTNVWYAIVDNSQLKDNVKITIEHKKFENENIVEISKLPLDYSMEAAVKDGCFTLKNNKIVSNNQNQIDEFIEKAEEGETCFLRVYNNYDGKIIIKDVNFENGIYYIDEGNPGCNIDEIYHDTFRKLRKRQRKDIEFIEYIFYEGRESGRNESLANIQNYLNEYMNIKNTL